MWIILIIFICVDIHLLIIVVVVSTNQKIRDLFKLFPDIKPKQAAKKLEIEYTKSFCNSFYLQKKVPLTTPTKTSSKKKKISPQEGITSGAPLTKRLSSDDLEKRLLMALEVNPNNPNLLRTAIDFYLKVMIKSDSMEDEIDMEALKRIGIIAESGD